MKQELEPALNRLEEIAETIEEGETSLEETLALYREGLKLSKKCETILGKYEQEITLLQKDADGMFNQTAFIEQ
jgi:exodeoxyribonuclease VII small subunit